MNIYIIGHKGRLGSELVRQGCGVIDIDITNKQMVWETLSNSFPGEIVVNCAAFTSVDGCETDDGMKRAVAVNVRGVENLRTVPNRRWKLFQISTDYVFDGQGGPYIEKNKNFDPVNSYGCTKLAAEVVISTLRNKGDCVIRTTGLYGSLEREDFASNVLRHLRDNAPIRVTEELLGNQTYIPHLAEAIIQLCKIDKTPPIVHLASLEVVSRCDFAQMIAKEFRLNEDLIIPVLNRDIPGWVADRPKRGGLNVDLALKMGLPIYSIKEGLKQYHGQYQI